MNEKRSPEYCRLAAVNYMGYTDANIFFAYLVPIL